MVRFFPTLCLALLSSAAAQACTIPVFRFALDRWEADKFHLALPASSSQDKALNELLRPVRANGKANLDIQISRDAALTQPELRASRDNNSTLWSGSLEKAALDSLLDSPGRHKILDHILAGDSVLWVLAESDSPEDAVHMERIEKRLKFLEQVAALPVQNPNDPDSQLGPGPPLLLKFSTLRLRRDDPAEALLLKMLAGPQGAVNPATTSFAAAVFGRGRVLKSWPLAELDEAALEDACMFLVGRCSCRVKNENPGWDILMNVDWEKALQGAKDAATTGAAKPASTSPKTPAVPVMVKQTVSPPPPVPQPLKVVTSSGTPDMRNRPTTGRALLMDYLFKHPRVFAGVGVGFLVLIAYLLLRGRR